MTQTAHIDTAPLFSRRTLHFNSIDEVLAEVDRIEAWQREGKLRSVGNWSAGQNLGHLAAWVDYSYDGAPIKLPFFLKIILKPMKHWILYKPMRAGARIPKVPGGTAGIDPMSFEEGVTRIRERFGRMKNECPKIPNMMFGVMTHEEWIALHLRHAELHLSYLLAE